MQFYVLARESKHLFKGAGEGKVGGGGGEEGRDGIARDLGFLV